MADDREKINQLVKAKTSSLQKRDSNIVSRGLYDLGLLDNKKAKMTQAKMTQVIGWFQKGVNCLKNKEYDKAIEAYSFAFALDLELDKASMGRGLAYYYKGQYDMAIKDFSKAIALNQNDVSASAYTNRGLAYERLGNKSMAISDYRKACDLGLEVGCENLQRVLRNR